MTRSSEYSALSHRFALLTALATLFLLLVGGLVTSNDAGLSVPDWPLSFGQVMPEMVGGVFYEHGHRLVATTVGFLTIILALILGRRDSRSGVRRLGWMALLAVVLQGVLGGLTVLYRLPPFVSVIHACLAQAFFCIVVTLAVVTSLWWRQRVEAARLPWSNSHFRLAAMTTLGVFLQLIFGATVRHVGTVDGAKAAEFVTWALILHLAGAALVSMMILLTAMNLLKDKAGPQLSRTAYTLVGGLVLQLALGVAAYAVRMSIASGQPHHPVMALLPTAHLALGALILASCLGLSLVLSQEGGRGPGEVALADVALARGSQN